MTQPAQPVLRTDLPGLLHRGKVRDVYDLGDRLMIVATDRISAFDVVMNEAVPGKGVLLTRMSEFWLGRLPACRPHHLDYVVTEDRVPAGYEAAARQLAGRASVCRKARVLPIECVVRGYLAGGGWKEYRERGAVSGVRLPAGLRPAERLDAPIFTPSTKASVGHDEPISFEDAAKRLTGIFGGGTTSLAEAMRDRSLAIYREAARHAESRGLILADTKFEFGLCDGELLLIDEVLTPDSSRFWPKDAWAPGRNPPSFDKQFLRDYLESQPWDKRPPPPPIPAEIIEKTRQKYAEAFRLITG